MLQTLEDDSYRTIACSSEACLVNQNNHDGIVPTSFLSWHLMSCKNCRTFFFHWWQELCSKLLRTALCQTRNPYSSAPCNRHASRWWTCFTRECWRTNTHTELERVHTEKHHGDRGNTHKPKQTQPKLTHRRLLLQPFCSTWKVFAPKVSAVLQRLLRDRHKSQRSVPSASSHLVRPSVFAPHVYTTFQRDLRSALSLDSIMFTCVETRSPCLSGVFPEDSSHRQSGIVQVSDITGRPRNNFPSKIGLVASASPFVLEIFSWKLCRLPLVLSSLFPSVVFRLHSSSVQCGLCSILQLPTPPRHSSLSFLFYLSFFQ